MDLDEIQSVQSRERQTDSLQQLRDSFYEEAGAFVQSLRAERDQAADRADDPFDAPEVTRLSDDIATAEQTLEAIYERRVGKIVKMASLAAADMPTEDDGLTTEERALYESLVAAIEQNRQRVFDVLDGDSSAAGAVTKQANPQQPTEGDADPQTDTGATPPEASTEQPADKTDGPDVSAADLMGEPDTESTDEPEPDADTTGNRTETAGGDDRPTAGTDDRPAPDSEAATSSEEGVERTTVRVTDDVGEILGVDNRAYDLSPDDVVELPDTNAKPLLEQGAVERLD